ncbi:MAG: right-handed parallel beta-helix repeat-containing protein [Candidatus Odinarchaeota archaeon]
MKMDKIEKSLVILSMIFVLSSLSVFVNGSTSISDNFAIETPLLDGNPVEQSIQAGNIPENWRETLIDPLADGEVIDTSRLKTAGLPLKPPVLEHDPIYINEDSDFGISGYNFNGSGTELDPYIIEGYNITSSSANLIHVVNTTEHFIIRNNLLNGIGGSYSGILLENVTNGLITGNIIRDTEFGVNIDTVSANNAVTRNIFKNNGRGKIAYILYNDNATADAYKSLLEANGFSTDLYTNSSIPSIVFDQYDLILIGSDTGSFADWGTTSEVNILEGSGKQIIGLGEGGYAFFGKLSLAIGYGNGYHGALNNITVVDSSHPVFNTPVPIGPGTVQLYSSTSHVGIYLPTPPSDVVLLGREPPIGEPPIDSVYYPLVQEKERYLLWGFTAGPGSMTQVGKDLFLNIISYIFNSSQAHDSGSNNMFDHNYWNDWIRPDDDTNGIVDYPYVIDGFTIANKFDQGDREKEWLFDSLQIVNYTTAQSFKPSMNNVNQIELLMNFESGTAAGVHVNLWLANSSYPDELTKANGAPFPDESNLIGYTSTEASSVPKELSLVTFKFAAPVPVVAGQEYWIVVNTSSSAADIRWAGNMNDNLYPDGYRPNVVSNPNWDMIFRTLSYYEGPNFDPYPLVLPGGQVPHDPIYINDDGDFAALGFPGSGTSGDPYRIEKYTITSSTETLIHVQNTRSFFIIGDNLLNGMDGSYPGIYFHDVRNAKIKSNVIHDTSSGIVVNASQEIVVSGNSIFDNMFVGIFLDDSALITIENNDIHNNGNLAETSGGSISIGVIGHGIFLDPSTRNTIRYNKVHDNGAKGVYLQYSGYNNILGNDIFGNGEDGLFLEDSNSNVIENNAIFENGYSTQVPSPLGASVSIGVIGHGIFLDPSSGNTVKGNHVFRNAVNGLYLLSSTATLIENNIIFDNGAGGVFLQDSNENTINGNDIFGNGYVTETVLAGASVSIGVIGHGIFLDPSNGNTIRENKVHDNAINGIYLYSSDKTEIMNNYVHNNGENGLFLEDSNENTIAGNEIFSNGYGTPVKESSGASVSIGVIGHGIFLDPSNGNTIKENDVHDNGIDGVYLFSSDNTMITGNKIHNNGENGVFLKDSSGNTIAGNEIFSNGHALETVLAGASVSIGVIGHGIFLDPSNDNTIKENNVHDNAINGIYLFSSDNTVISGNKVHNNGENGVFLEDSDSNNISGNEVSGNGYRVTTGSMNDDIKGKIAIGVIGHGIFLDPSSNNIIASNLITNNALYGVAFIDGSDNAVMFNNFIDNNLEGTSQAYDSGIASKFQYNYWNDHDNTDEDGDGIADKPYSIDGPADNWDSTPKAEPNTPGGEDYLRMPIVQYPNGGEKLSGGVIVEWLPAQDSLGHEVSYTLFYSGDAGGEWFEIVSDLTETTYKWDTSTLKPGGEYLIKVKATCSGGLSAEDESDSLFTIERSGSTGFTSPGWTIGIILLAVPALVAIRKYERKN